MRAVVLLCAVVTLAHAAHLLELQLRERPVEENRQLLELLQVEEAPGKEVPNVKLNTNFFGTILIGKDKQPFEVVFDTGSDALWVYSDQCSECKQHHKHTFHRDTSYHQRPTEFSIKYGTGESHGTTGTDTLILGDLEVTNQVFGQCDQPDEVMKGFPFDGIVGLSRPMFMDPNGLVPIMETVKKEKVLEHKKMPNTFSFFLGREEGEKSYLIFGGSHHMLHEGALHYVPTLSKNIFWELPLDDILIHHKEGGTEALSKSERALERELAPRAHASLVHDKYAQLMADPYDSAPVAEVVDVNPPAKHKKESSWFGDRIVSADGYEFVTDAEPILLELESTLTAQKTSHLSHKQNKVKKAHSIQKSALDLEAEVKTSKHSERDTVQSHLKPKHTGAAHAHHDMEENILVDTVASAVNSVFGDDSQKDSSKEDPFDMHTPKNSGLKAEAPKLSKPEVRTHSLKEMKEASKKVAETHKSEKKTETHAKQEHEALAAAVKSEKKSEKTPGKEHATVSKSAKKSASADSSPRGNGELLSDFPVTPGVSMSPCTQDSTHPCVLSLDSGHSLISGPPEIIRRLKQHTMPPGACTEEATAGMPDVSFVIGGKLFTLTPMDYLIELEGQCTPAFRERQFRNGHDWVLGEHFMRTFYTVFDYDDMRVGLARLDNIKEHLDTILTR